jgi:hypothetical protein
VAVLLLKPFPENKRDWLERDRRGLLLANGDFFECELKELNEQAVAVTSVLFGARKYNVKTEVQALILRGPKPSATPMPSNLKGFAPVGVKPPAEREEK